MDQGRADRTGSPSILKSRRAIGLMRQPPGRIGPAELKQHSPEGRSPYQALEEAAGIVTWNAIIEQDRTRLCISPLIEQLARILQHQEICVTLGILDKRRRDFAVSH